MAPALLEFGYSIVTFSLLYFFTSASLRRTKNQKRFWFAFGFLFNFLSGIWLYAAYPLSWLPAGILQLAAMFLVHLIFSLAGGIGFSLVGFAFSHGKPWSRLILFSVLLALAEIIRSLIVSAVFLGAGNGIGLHWSASAIGNALSITPFVEYAYFGGVYMLTFIAGLLVMPIADRKNLARWWIVPGLICALTVLIHYAVPVRMPPSGTKVAVMTTDFTTAITKENLASEFARRFEKLHDMTRSLEDTNVNMIAYPEDARYLSHASQKDTTLIKSSFPNTIFVDGDTERSTTGFYNYSLFYVPQKGNTVIARAKVFLFPFNEYIPYLFTPLFRTLVKGTQLEEYIATRSYVAAKKMEVFNQGPLSVGTLICSEIISYSTLEKLSEKNPNIVIFQSYLDSFHGNPLFLAYERSFGKVAAAQLRTPLIESVNGSESYMISPYGYIVSVIPRGFSVSTADFSARSFTVKTVSE